VPRSEAHTVERKLAAIFAADVEGYSRLMGVDEVGTLRTLSAYRVIIDRLIASDRGRIFNTAGDSLVADFASAVDAVQCAIEVQDAIAKENADRPAGEQMRFRIGIQVGDIIVQGDNLFGDAVNIAARLEALAEPGGICVSGTVRDQIGTKLPLPFTDLGDQQVKNIAQPIRAYRVRGDTSPTVTQAEALCRRALLIAPRYTQARSLLAWVLLRGHRPQLQEAFTEAIAALSVDERDAWAHLTHGIALWRMRRLGEADQAFRRAVDFNPNFALAHAFLGCPLATRGADEEAIRSAERALRLSPIDGLVSAYASFALVFAHFAGARYADGVIWARKLIDKQPENLVANYLLIAACAMQKDSAATAEALASLLRLRPDFSLTWVSGTTPLIGEVADRVLEGLRTAGVPE
jgi:class 3 adenylate cyclase